MKLPIISFLFLGLCLAPSCTAQDETKLIEMGNLAKVINESSGLAAATQTSLWTHNDRGGRPEIYEIGLRGELIRTVVLVGINPVDMEDMSQDNSGNLFIADTGNNKRDRLKLMIYKFNVKDIRNDSIRPEVIEFVLPERGLENECHYDFEALTWSNDALYLFTKDRCDKKDNKLILYSLPDQAGKYTAENKGEFYWEDPDKNIKITGADMSFDGKRLVLLSKDALHFFFAYRKDQFFNGAYRFLPIEKSKKEGLVHLNDCDLYITEEAQKETPARIWKINLCSLKF